MKKLFANVCGKLVLASLALVGVLSSCIKEDIGTTFETKNAVATITVTVVDVATLANVTDVAKISATSSLSSAKLNVSGNVITITGDKAIAAQDLNITATWNGYTSTYTQPIAAVLAGGESKYPVKMIIGEIITPEDIKYEARIKNQVARVDIAYINDSHVAYHDGLIYRRNNTEFMQFGDVKYKSYYGGVVSGLKDDNVKFTSQYAEALSKDFEYAEKEEVMKIQVSAWALYTVWETRTVTTYSFETYRINLKTKAEEKIGEFTFTAYTNTTCEYKEVADPEAHGHYVHGHGTHGLHGESDNAGGGIAFAD